MAGKYIDATLRFIDSFTKPFNTAVKGLTDSSKTIVKAGKQIESAGKSIEGMGKSLAAGVTLPLAGVATACITTAAQFETAMSKVQALSGASGDELKALEEKAKQMGATTKYSASESAEAFQYMALAGWDAAQMIDGIEGIMYLAASSGEDLALVSDIVTDSISAFGLAADDASRFADVLATTSASSNTTVAMLGEAFQYVGSVAGAMNYEIEDVSLALGLMANAGIKSTSAGTALRSLLTRMASPTKASAAAMDALGVSLTNSDGTMKSMGVLLDDLRASFAGLTEEQAASHAANLAGKTGMSGLLAIVNASEEDYNKLSEAIAGSTGSAQEMADVMNDNLQGRLTLLKSQFEGIAITLGQKLMPYVEKGVALISDLATKFSELSDEQIESILRFAGIAAAVPLGIMAFGRIVRTLGTTIKTFGLAGKAIRNAGGIIKALASPANLAVAGIALLIAGGILLVKNWDKIKAAGKKVSDQFRELVNWTKEHKTGLTLLGVALGTITTLVLAYNAASIAAAIASGAETAAIYALYAADGVAAIAKGALTAATTVWTTVSTVATTATTALGAAVSFLCSPVGLVILAIGAAVAAGVLLYENWELVKEKALALGAKISEVFTGIKNSIAGAFSGAAEVVKDAINGIIGKINTAIGFINKFTGSAAGIANKVLGTNIDVSIPNIPMLYTGTDNWVGGPAMIHDRGAEIVDLPSGSRVYPHDASLQMARAEGAKSGGKSVTVNIQKIAEVVQISDGEDVDSFAERFARKLEEVLNNTDNEVFV